MRATEIIRAVLDLLDQEDAEKDNLTGKIEVQRTTQDDESARFMQVLDLLSKGNEPAIANAPDEKYADIDAVTTLAGGGVNGPKHPADIRVKDPRGFE
jgi:hypothetical protein